MAAASPQRKPTLLALPWRTPLSDDALWPDPACAGSLCSPFHGRFLGQLDERRHHDNGPVSDSDLNAEGVIALAIIFAIEGGGRIVARTGQKEFERFVRSVRKNKPDFEEGWAALVAKVPVQHHPVLLDRIDSYRRSCTVVHKILTRASMKSLFEDLENYAGSELDADYS